ncbi:MAG: cytochrome c biogenesis protein CcsA [Xanthomonadales bacterium]|nr:cytochrome c biogenesis protein CcsA [Xanthomonadales bacterium]
MQRFWIWLSRYASPPVFYRTAGLWRPWLGWATLLVGGPALIYGLFFAPPDYLQGESYRIIFIHVPSAWVSMFAYTAMAGAGAAALIWHTKLSEIAVVAIAPIGAGFTAITLVTGMLWGRPTWGAYWVWDARLTSELVLLFLYLGVIGLASAYGDARRGARAAALLSLVGLVNLPIIHYSVRWWNTLHQGSTVRMFGESSIHGSMLWALLAAALAAKLYFVWSLLGRLQLRLLSAESEKAWVARELKLEPSDA